MKIAVISPVYKAERIVDELVTRLRKELLSVGVDFEILLVDDGSPDDSWERIQENARRYDEVRGLKLSRNFGQHYAVTAGIAHVGTSDAYILMDCDLQDDPENIPLFLAEWKRGVEIVFSRRKQRGHSFSRSVSSLIFNRLFYLLSDKTFSIDSGTMILFTEKARQAFLQVRDADRLYLQLFKWIGFSQSYITVKHSERYEGKTTYSLGKLLKLAFQGYTAFSCKLLFVTLTVGAIISTVSFLAILFIILMYFIQGFQSGWASLIVSIFFSTGLILISLGVVGLYVGKTFEQVKNRPLYLIDEEAS